MSGKDTPSGDEKLQSNDVEAAFVSGLKATAGDMPIIMIDPDSLASDNPDENYQTLRENLEEQNPGILASYTEHINNNRYPGTPEFTEEDVLKSLVNESQNIGPFAEPFNHNGTTVCLANQLGSKYDEMHEIVKKASGVSVEDQNPISVDMADVAEFIGAHEGEHCNQDVVPADTPDKDLANLRREVGSDRAARAHMDDVGKPEVTELVQELRALRSGHDIGNVDHSSALFMHGNDDITKDHVKAVTGGSNFIKYSIADHLDVPVSDVDKIMAEDYGRYKEAADAVIAEIRADDDVVDNLRADIHLEHRKAVESRLMTPEASESVLERANDGMGDPDVAGDAAMASMAAEQSGSNPDIVKSISPSENAPSSAPDMQQQQQQDINAIPGAAPPPLDFKY